MNLNGNYIKSYPKEWIEDEIILRAFIQDPKIINPGEIVEINTGFIISDKNFDNLSFEFHLFNKNLSKNYLKIISDENFIKNNSEIILYIQNGFSPYCISRKDNNDGTSIFSVFPNIFNKITINPGDVIAKLIVKNKEKTFWVKNNS